MTSGLETEWDYSGRKGRDGQKKKIGKANERKRKVIKGGKDEEVHGQGGKRVPRPHTGRLTWEEAEATVVDRHQSLAQRTHVESRIRSPCNNNSKNIDWYYICMTLLGHS